MLLMLLPFHRILVRDLKIKNVNIAEVKELIQSSGICRDTVCSIVYKHKNEKVYNPAHLSMYISDNPSNFKIERYDLH